MSFLKGKMGRSVAVVAFTLGAYQALSIVGATSAFAAIPASATCTTSGGVVTVSVPDDSSFVYVWEDTNGGIHASASTAALAGPPFAALGGANDIPAAGSFTGCTGVQAGVATTTAINITGGSGLTTTDQHVFIEMAKFVNNNPAAATLPATQAQANWGAINWTVSLGADGVLGDSFGVTDSNTQAGAAFNLTGGANGFDLDSDGNLDVTTAGVEHFSFVQAPGSLADNTIDLNGSTIAGGPFASAATITDAGAAGTVETLSGGSGNDIITAGAGDDMIAPGLGSDSIACAGNTAGYGQGVQDTLDYSDTTTAINANLPTLTITQGSDLDTTDGVAGASNCENVIGTSAGDTLTGDSNNNTFQPGDGNDAIDGGAGGADRVDYSDAKAGVTVDLTAGTETGGSGSDTIKNVEDVNGSDFNDSLTGNASAAGNYLFGNGGNDLLNGGDADNAGGGGPDRFDGGSGIDTVSYADNTLPTSVNVGVGVVACSPDGGVTAALCTGTNGVAAQDDLIVNNTVENAILGAGDDTFAGSLFNNDVWPNGGQNALVGGGGIDTVNYSMGYTAGVTINLTNGGGTGGSSDSITGFANAVGTAFNDNMTGSDVLLGGGTGANLLVGGKGNDSISGNAGPDLIRGGAGNDNVRGGSGDDNMYGGGGNDNLRGGTGDDNIWGGKGKDFCIGGGGHDLIKSCEKPVHHHHGPNGPSIARALLVKP